MLNRKRTKHTIKRENRNLSDTSEDSNTIKRFPSKILDHKISKKEKFKAPIPVEKSDVYKCKKYTQNGSIYFSMTDLLFFLKNTFKIDCDNFILKDEQKQEFKVKMNSFMTDYTIIHSRYDQTMILIDHQNVELFFDLISKFVNKKLDELMNKFLIFSKNLKSEEVKENIEYIKPIAFVCENPIRAEEAYKKKVGHYVKYKTIPKWHHYAWDMINQISNSRKSFLFSQFVDEEDHDHSSKRKLDLGRVTLKLKLKIYNNISEFIDELMKMIKYSSEYYHKLSNTKNTAFCKMMETRIQKQVKKLKEEGKI